jgi:hypothetical protein
MGIRFLGREILLGLDLTLDQKRSSNTSKVERKHMEYMSVSTSIIVLLKHNGTAPLASGISKLRTQILK